MGGGGGGGGATNCIVMVFSAHKNYRALYDLYSVESNVKGATVAEW